MRRFFIGGNWKMNGSLEENRLLCLELMKNLSTYVKDRTIVLFPPFPYLLQTKNLTGNSGIKFGAQDCSIYDKGAYTGEVSSYMLKDIGCSHVLIGHSERRQFFNENDDTIVRKFLDAKKYNLIPILCVGENQAERESNQAQNVIKRQLEAIIESQPIDIMKNSIIAYEPIWAIGTGLSATATEANEMHRFIRNLITKKDRDIGANIQIIYGGSLKGDNAKDIFKESDIDGGLVGGASLIAFEFAKICELAI